ncbi:MAG: hypothetical protein SFT90_04110 [Rickettsiales bacterium]|nr:hypothetical protein [Rickettsiales bacterium]
MKKTFILSFLTILFFANSSNACEFHRNNARYKNAVCFQARSQVEKRRCEINRKNNVGYIFNKTRKYPDIDYVYNAKTGLYHRRLISRSRMR